MFNLSENEKQAIHGALRKYLEIVDLPENIKSASESALLKIKNDLKKITK